MQKKKKKQRGKAGPKRTQAKVRLRTWLTGGGKQQERTANRNPGGRPGADAPHRTDDEGKTMAVGEGGCGA